MIMEKDALSILQSTFELVQTESHEDTMSILKKQFQNCLVMNHQMLLLSCSNPFSIFYSRNIRQFLGTDTDQPCLQEMVFLIKNEDKGFVAKAIKEVFNWILRHKAVKNQYLLLMEYRINHKSGKTKIVQMNTRTLAMDSNNLPLFNLTLVTDISSLQSDSFQPRAVLSDPRTQEQFLYMTQDIILDNSISRREFEVLKLLCKGHTSCQIAESLFISRHTVDGHRRKLLKKTGLLNSQELISFSIRHKLIQID